MNAIAFAIVALSLTLVVSTIWIYARPMTLRIDWIVWSDGVMVNQINVRGANMDFESIAVEERDIQCPFCFHWHEATGSHEDDDGTWECHGCEEEFEVDIEYDPTYKVSKPKSN